ncbi:MAG: 16S rRNA (cytidine(1402)-2'-O)-methyltransferase [Bryobacteraceae bacterium]
MAGTLYLVATPIGNLEDITLRALRILRDEVHIIACEDTRQTQKLLTHFDIRKPLISYHEHNETTQTENIVRALSQGESVAIVSDAGTPLVSDPGYRVVTAAIANGYRVVPIPGASAVLAALGGSGLSTDSFQFVGFLPPKSGARRKALESFRNEPSTVIAYESPHRILESLEDISQILRERQIVLARELTKLHEEFLRGTARSIRQELESRGTPKGEMTLVIGGGTETAEITDVKAEVERLTAELSLDRMEAIKFVAKQMGLPKQEVYRRVAGPGSSSRDRRRD